MSPDEESRRTKEIASSDLGFKIHMVEKLGAIGADVKTLKDQTTEQFTRLRQVELDGVGRDGRLDKVESEERKPGKKSGAVAGGGTAGVVLVLEWARRWLFE